MEKTKTKNNFFSLMAVMVLVICISSASNNALAINLEGTEYTGVPETYGEESFDDTNPGINYGLCAGFDYEELQDCLITDPSLLMDGDGSTLINTEEPPAEETPAETPPEEEKKDKDKDIVVPPVEVLPVEEIPVEEIPVVEEPPAVKPPLEGDLDGDGDVDNYDWWLQWMIDNGYLEEGEVLGVYQERPEAIVKPVTEKDHSEQAQLDNHLSITNGLSLKVDLILLLLLLIFASVVDCQIKIRKLITKNKNVKKKK
jgi:hypothetical protein